MFLGLLVDSAILTGCEDDKILLSLRVDEVHLLVVGHAQVFLPIFASNWTHGWATVHVSSNAG